MVPTLANFIMFKKIKDWGSSHAAAVYLRAKIDHYAELEMLEIDSSAKKIRVVIKLKGEADAIDLRVNNYELSQENEKNWVIVSQVECSREWLHLLAADHLVGKKLKIPGVVAKLL